MVGIPIPCMGGQTNGEIGLWVAVVHCLLGGVVHCLLGVVHGVVVGVSVSVERAACLAIHSSCSLQICAYFSFFDFGRGTSNNFFERLDRRGLLLLGLAWKNIALASLSVPLCGSRSWG